MCSLFTVYFFLPFFFFLTKLLFVFCLSYQYKDVFLEIDKFIMSFESFCFFSFSSQKWENGKPSRPKYNLGWRGPLLPQGDSEHRMNPPPAPSVLGGS